MTAAERYVSTAAIRLAVSGRELDILAALGVHWCGSQHIHCPYPDHADKHPSWRWDAEKGRAYCTCTRSDSIFDVIGKLKDISFEIAKIVAAELIGRIDLIRDRRSQQYGSATPTQLLNPPAENRNDALAWKYLAHRLDIQFSVVPRPTTKVVGIKSLPYFDPPKVKGGKPLHVGDFPAAVFETTDRDGHTHAHRIYLTADGAGKAELGVMAGGTPRNPKKAAKKRTNENTAGHAVIFGDPSKAETELIFEGIETATAAAFAFEPEIACGKIMVGACITAGGIEAFKPWPAAKLVIVGADRDEHSENGNPPTRRGEAAALKFARLHHHELAVSIALPGKTCEKVDWLDVLRSEGVEAVRAGISRAKPFNIADQPSDESQPTQSNNADDLEVARLARLSPLNYDRVREPRAKQLGCRVTTLDEQVKKARGETANAIGQGQPINVPEVEPWNEPVEGAALLTALSKAMSTYVIVSNEQADAAALWSIRTHGHDASDVSPPLVLKSAQKRSGKSRLAEVLERIVARPLLVSGITAAALLRIIEMQAPTLLLDEIDALMKQDREMAEALRGIINSAFSRAGARFILNVPVPGGGYEPRQFSTWAPLLLSGIGNLPDTVRDRSIEIEMFRKRREEKVRRLRRRDGDDLNVLGRKSARWVRDNLERLREVMPGIPAGLNDRAADAWESLFAIADLAGGDWPQRARKAALTLCGEQAKEDDNIATQLLLDIRAVFATEQIRSQTLVEELVSLEGHQWAEFGKNGKPLTQNKLARLLKPYKIRPGTIRTGPREQDTAKGYKLAQFADVFERYLPDPSIQTVTPSQANESEAFCDPETVTPTSNVADENGRNAPDFAGCDAVTGSDPPFTDDAYADLLPEEETAL
jgi:phage/plasmid primase-like uncharacterized protein